VNLSVHLSNINIASRRSEEVDEDGDSALILAVFGKLEVVRWLLQEGGTGSCSRVAEGRMRECRGTEPLTKLKKGCSRP
jgi:hypothetical protein